MSDRDLRIRVLLAAMDKASGPLTAIRDASKKAGQAIRETRADITRLEKAQADIHGFRDLKRGLSETGTRLDDARKRTSALARQIEQTDRPTRELTREFSRAKREAADLGREFDRQQRELQETRDRLRDAGVSTRNLADDERKLVRELGQANSRLAERNRHYAELKRTAPRRMQEARAAAQVDREMAREGRMQRPQDGGSGGLSGVIIGRLPVAMGLAAGYGALREVTDGIKANAAYESTLTSIGQKANLTRNQAQRLGETLRKLSPDVARLPQDMAGSVDTLAGIGLLSDFDSIKDPEKRFLTIQKATVSIMRATGRAATAYEAEQNDLVNSVAAGVANLKIPAEQAQRILDIMAAGDNAGAFGMKAMAGELPALTGAWGALGQTGDKALGQLVAGLQITRTLAGDDAEAANNLRNLILKLNSRELAKNFDKFGVDLPKALKKAKSEGRDLLEVVAELTLKATKGDNDKIGQIFTDQQAQMGVTALITKLGKYKKLRDDVMNSGGTVDKAFDERMKDQTAKLKRLETQWASLKQAMGKKTAPATNFIIDAASDKLEQVTANIEARGVGNTLGSMMPGGHLLSTADAKSIERLKATIDARDRKREEERKTRATAYRQILLRAKPDAVPPMLAAPKKAKWPIPAPPPMLAARPRRAARPGRSAERSAPQLGQLRPVEWPQHATPVTPRRPKPPKADLSPAQATAGLRKIGEARAAELTRQNTQARSLMARGLADQRSAGNQAVTEAGRVRSRMRQQLGGSSEYSSLGRNMMLGLAGGMIAGLPGVLASITTLSGRIKGAFRGQMKIKSPSRVFDGYGRFITVGLARGIDGGSRSPLASIRSLARRMAEDGAPIPPKPIILPNPKVMPGGRAMAHVPALPRLPAIPAHQIGLTYGRPPRPRLPELLQREIRWRAERDEAPAQPPLMRRLASTPNRPPSALPRAITPPMPHALRRSAVEDVRIEPPRRPDKNTLDRRGESNTSRRSARPIVFSGPITIKVEAQPGQDGADLAKQIKDALAEQARAAEARRASSYEDMD